MHATLKITAALGFTALVAAGCAPNRFQTEASTSGLNRTQSAFDNAVAANYRKLSDLEYKQGDHKDGDTYALRAVAASQGAATTPDDLKNRRIPASATSEVAQGRQRLVAALDRNGRTAKPDVAAYAQASFDCWVEQLAEDLQPNHIQACKDAFMKALAELEKAPPPAAAAPKAPTDFMVFFDWNKSNLTPEALKIISDAVAAAKKEGARQIRVVGHTDTSGSAEYNMRLGQRRADAVAAQMVRLGIPATAVVTSSVGQNDLLVPTPDNVREAQNRRAVIGFPRSSASLDQKSAIGIDIVN